MKKTTITRQDIKDIVKECLVEILAEGIGPMAASRVATYEGRRRQESQRPKRPSGYADPLDQRVNDPVQPMQQTAALKDAIIRESGGNKLMMDIFADTASRTLPSMLRGGDSQIGSSSPQSMAPAIGNVEQFRGNPEDVFGEDSASRWADLAFNAPSPGKIAT
jgi:hypothetical protein